MTFLKGITKVNFAPKRPIAFKISEKILITSFLKVPSFIYLRPLVEKLRGIKVRVLENFEDFMHHQMNECE